MTKRYTLAEVIDRLTNTYDRSVIVELSGVEADLSFTYRWAQNDRTDLIPERREHALRVLHELTYYMLVFGVERDQIKGWLYNTGMGEYGHPEHQTPYAVLKYSDNTTDHETVLEAAKAYATGQ